MGYLLTVFLFADAIKAKLFSQIGYLDEFIAITFLLYYLVSTKIRKDDNKIIICAFILLFIGVLSSLLSHLAPSVLSMIYDAFNVFKYIFVVLGASLYFKRYKNKQVLIHYLANIIKVVVIISSVFMVLNFITDIGMSTDIRYGLRSYNFIFKRVGSLYSACIIWIIILTAELYYHNSKINKFCILLALLNMCSTLRSRPFAFAIVYVSLYYLFIIRKEFKFKWWYLALAMGLIYFVASDQVEYYFSGDKARNILLKYGIKTASDYFPLGGGFATYGTAVARDTYSALYTKYGFSHYYGLSEDFKAFLTDNYWPAILGEFGCLGLLTDIALLGFVFKKLLKEVNNKYSKVCALFVIIDLLIMSLVNSSFFACSQLMVFCVWYYVYKCLIGTFHSFTERN